MVRSLRMRLAGNGWFSVALVCGLWMATAAATAWGSSPPPTADAGGKGFSGNPVLPGWYADPESAIFGKQYWIYPTYSAAYEKQLFFDAFSSPDLVNWTKHPRVLDVGAVSWVKEALWAPAIVEKGGKYYLFFSANDIHSDDEVGGIGVAVADRPQGPFRDLLGKPLVGAFHHGAQPIDPDVFRDDDGSYYLLYGGWDHLNIARLKPDFTGFESLPDGNTFKEITPDQYVEGPMMFRRDGKYYLMWSEGGWTGPDYAVAYAIGDSPLGPFKRIGRVLQQDPSIATGAGHHSLLHTPDDHWYIVYHRRPKGETEANHRAVSIDRLHFDARGLIQPVKITRRGVKQHPLR